MCLQQYSHNNHCSCSQHQASRYSCASRFASDCHLTCACGRCCGIALRYRRPCTYAPYRGCGKQFGDPRYRQIPNHTCFERRSANRDRLKENDISERHDPNITHAADVERIHHSHHRTIRITADPPRPTVPDRLSSASCRWESQAPPRTDFCALMVIERDGTELWS
ncbi:hypothetical protein BDZ85DRAFT_45435 [Elsinoe ampelina]|uniref:Uncharacterized protein n=1 Tax=Elsinoe ampelina TaxID=302913 RepID=A0A6A6G0U5_9PEZI|nr:hypothetical protein BDZ85DRAFT_45435 [Elsinoe ampelina]